MLSSRGVKQYALITWSEAVFAHHRECVVINISCKLPLKPGSHAKHLINVDLML